MRNVQSTLAIVVIVLVMLSGSACQRKNGASNGPLSGTQIAAGDARAAESEGSLAETTEDGICSEHGIPESVDTKCHPKLIPAFQSKGDWCAEHGFPESYCPICHPDKAMKTADAAGSGPPDGLHVKLQSADIASEVGIETAKALPGGEAGTILATATIVADNAKSALVNLRVPGVIRAFKVELGSRVATGDPLASIESASVGEGRAKLLAARARVSVADSTYRREKQLFDMGVTSRKDFQAAGQSLEEARAELASASATLGMIGTETGEAGIYELRAPIAGVITQRNFTVGTLVDEADPLIEIMDTSLLWADIDVPESRAPLVSAGKRVVLKVDGLPDREFEGTIRYVAPAVDPRTRTVKARAALDNREGVLRANMYAQARIFADVGSSSVAIPRAALQEAGGGQIVFVPVSPGDYMTRRVRVLPSDGGMVAVTEGLQAGETVVTTGSFLLKTETLKESIGAGCCDNVESGK